MKITKSRLKQIIKEELKKVLMEIDADGDGDLDPDELRALADQVEQGSTYGRQGSHFGYTGGGNIPIRSDEIRDAYRHRGLKVPFSLEDEGLDANVMGKQGFRYVPHDEEILGQLRGDDANEYAYTQGFWFDPEDDWREARLKAHGKM